MTDTWAVGDEYEPYIGRWSRRVAHDFVTWLGVPAQQRWLDVGCGTGALTEAIVELADPASVIAVEPSEGFLAFARRRVTDPRVRFAQGDARALPVDDASCDACVSGLVLNFVPDVARAVGELRRAARPGGVVATYLWDYAGEMQLIRRFWDAAIALDPAAADLDEGQRFPICEPAALSALFASEGLTGVEVRAIDVPTVFRDFDDYWQPFLGAQGPAPGYAMALPDDRRAALRERLRATLPTAADGRIELRARAWAVRSVA
ncbi:MAG TPA: class I SAM-dependent methyltransferase [Kofleriaceae bacterium]|nr:class I SAM-dependent methyltransferase [Kofleriaceae bacterium]